MRSLILTTTLLLGTLLATLLAAQPETVEQERLVLTALPVTYNLSSRLLAGSDVEVRILPARGRRLGGLERYFQSQADRLTEPYAATEAVVGIGKLWPEDPLFPAARAGNIRVVNIDATAGFGSDLEGIAVAMIPEPDAPWAVTGEHAAEPSVWYWLSLANAIRSTDIIASDLVRLFPEHSRRISDNQLALRAEIADLLRRYELALAQVPDITVFSLAPELVYFTSELGLFVDGSFYKQDIDWTEADLQAFESYLRDRRIPVVLHKWDPEPPITAAIDRAGAQLVVLETLDAGIVEEGQMRPDSYLSLMRQNLEQLLVALRDSSQLN